jgi:hypothetical protein
MKAFSPGSNTPSSEFQTAAALWDKSKTSTGDSTIHLPTVAVKYIKEKTKLVADPANPGRKGAVELDINSAVEVTETVDPAHKDWQNVVVIDGPHTGERGWVMSAALSVTQSVPGKQTVHRRP